MKIENTPTATLVKRIIEWAYDDNYWIGNDNILELRRRILMADDINTQVEIIANIIHEAGMYGVDPTKFS